MTRKLLALAALALSSVACTPQIDLPSEIAAVGLDAPTTALLQDALDQWCEATAGRWCPEIVDGAAFEVRGDARYSARGRNPLSVGFYEHGTEHLVLNTERELPADAVHQTLLHEIGHLRVEGHLRDPHALMAAHNCLEWAADGTTCRTFAQMGCIDQASAEAFCDGEGWSGCASTCEESP